MDNDRDKCISYGMDEFMSKPFDIEKLNSIVEELKIPS
jgi:osomolarity two-component system sensor histidine kinase NIK1